MNTYANIGSRIKKARKAAKLSQSELAAKLDKTLRTIQKYESGEIRPSVGMINSIADILHVSPVDLIGYQRQELRLDTMADVLYVLNELNRKSSLHFSIDVKRPPDYNEWTCSLRFNGNDREHEHNADLCQFLERYAEARDQVETYWTDQAYFDHWFEEELAYYASTALPDKEPEVLSTDERLKRRNELDRQMIEAKEKAAENGGE